jgi:imidazolonepropionase-like amidohydrolase
MKITPKSFTALLLVGVTTFSLSINAAESSSQILFTNVSIFDGVSEELITDKDVLVEGNLIKQIAPAIKAEGAEVIDGAGRVLMPGLIEGHAHVGIPEKPSTVFTWSPQYQALATAAEAERQLMRGFTSVRDLGGNILEVKRAIDDGLMPGPRIYAAEGFITPTGGSADFRPEPHIDENPDNSYMQRLGVIQIADSADEVTKAVRKNISRGAAFVKIYTTGNVSSNKSPLEVVSYGLVEMKAAVIAARQQGTYASAHAHNQIGAQHAIDAGITVIEHATNLSEKQVRQIKKKGIWVSPGAYACSLAQDPPAYIDPEPRRKYMQIGPDCKRTIELIAKYGEDINVIFGSDKLGSPAQQREQLLEFAARAKLWPVITILRQATSINGRMLKLSNIRDPYKQGELGVIKEGAYADMIILDQNPLENIRVFENPDQNLKLIMKDGKIYKNTL